MPYRRLPNTDNARIRSLKMAINKIHSSDIPDLIKYDTQSLGIMLRNFENAQMMYRQALDNQVAENKKFQKLIKNARLYISHFIQVLNLSIIRGEIKKEVKPLYGLNEKNYAVPDLSSNEAILTWGENILKGEGKRLQIGGTPIYNPTIARVNVAFSQFKEAFFNQKTYQSSTARQLEALSQQRESIDETLATLWNDIETVFCDYPPNKKIEVCKEFGIVYYLRKNEKDRITKESEC